MHHLAHLEWVDDGKDYYCAEHSCQSRVASVKANIKQVNTLTEDENQNTGYIRCHPLDVAQRMDSAAVKSANLAPGIIGIHVLKLFTCTSTPVTLNSDDLR